MITDLLFFLISLTDSKANELFERSRQVVGVFRRNTLLEFALGLSWPWRTWKLE